MDEQENCAKNSCFELLCVVHMMAVLTLMDANEKLIPKESVHSERLVSPGMIILYLPICSKKSLNRNNSDDDGFVLIRLYARSCRSAAESSRIFEFMRS